ncbi:MAG TPA: DUF6544 family protein [Vicinamibacterales bacterium]|nr:DUF6544 family protein [Vicinamibacterales bacterium]
MVTVFALLLALHGLIHLIGAAKAFGADFPQIAQPISPIVGGLWLLAAGLFLATALLVFLWPRGWWAIGAAAVAISMSAIVASWADAKVGALANAIVLVGVVFGFLAQGPFSLRARYDRDVRSRVSTAASPLPVTERDLAHLPAPVQRYLRTAGVVGQPRVRTFRVRLHGRIRGGRTARWMPLRAEQYNVVEPAARLFYLNASMFGIPVQGYHRYLETSASMEVRAAALVPVARAAGPEMTRSETVTLFNDMCLMAPATLIGSSIEWETVDARTARARFTNAGHTIRAELFFNEAGELTNFVSDDRSAVSAGGTMRPLRWSTPVAAYRRYGSIRLFSRGEGRWQEPDGEYVYIELIIDDVRYNVPPH